MVNEGVRTGMQTSALLLARVVSLSAVPSVSVAVELAVFGMPNPEAQLPFATALPVPSTSA